MSERVTAGTFRRAIPSVPDAVDGACRALRAFLSTSAVSAASFGVELVARELLNNAVLHGNRSRADKRVSIGLCIGRRWITLRVDDDGPGFDWRRASRCAHAAPEKTCGRGLIIAGRYGAGVRFNRAGNSVTVRFEKPAE
jgi:anti-sigma regulatory factor (Ser/Thr protein kinase)